MGGVNAILKCSTVSILLGNRGTEDRITQNSGVQINIGTHQNWCTPILFYL
jgi:hypothetical protein